MVLRTLSNTLILAELAARRALDYVRRARAGRKPERRTLAFLGHAAPAKGA